MEVPMTPRSAMARRGAADPDNARIALVLGAGGTVGCAYHAGVLYGLQHATGWDARRATTIVGTSAGALVGALVRSDVGPCDLVRLVLGQGFAPDERLYDLQLATAVETVAGQWWLRSIRPPTIAGLWQSAWHRSVRPAMLSMTRAPSTDHPGLFDEVERLTGSPWPADDLRVCAVSAASGRRRVLHHGSGVPVSTAVAASCAVPGVFEPARFEDDRLVDGGVHSVTNIDVAPFDDLDEVWVIAPMAGALYRQVVTAAVRRRIHGRLRRELSRVPDHVRVRVFEPGAAAARAMGTDLMSTDRAARTLHAAFQETVGHFVENRQAV
jgi:NTE family protein